MAFNPNEVRDEHGRWSKTAAVKKLAELAKSLKVGQGEEVGAGTGVKVYAAKSPPGQGRTIKQYEVGRPGSHVGTFKTADEAAQAALKESAASSHPNSLGGHKSYPNATTAGEGLHDPKMPNAGETKDAFQQRRRKERKAARKEKSSGSTASPASSGSTASTKASKDTSAEKVPKHTLAGVRNALGAHSKSTSHTTSVKGWHNITSGWEVSHGKDGNIVVSHHVGQITSAEGHKKSTEQGLARYEQTLKDKGFNVTRQGDSLIIPGDANHIASVEKKLKEAEGNEAYSKKEISRLQAAQKQNPKNHSYYQKQINRERDKQLKANIRADELRRAMPQGGSGADFAKGTRLSQHHNGEHIRTVEVTGRKYSANPDHVEVRAVDGLRKGDEYNIEKQHLQPSTGAKPNEANAKRARSVGELANQNGVHLTSGERSALLHMENHNITSAELYHHQGAGTKVYTLDAIEKKAGGKGGGKRETYSPGTKLNQGDILRHPTLGGEMTFHHTDEQGRHVFHNPDAGKKQTNKNKQANFIRYKADSKKLQGREIVRAQKGGSNGDSAGRISDAVKTSKLEGLSAHDRQKAVDQVLAQHKHVTINGTQYRDAKREDSTIVGTTQDGETQIGLGQIKTLKGAGSGGGQLQGGEHISLQGGSVEHHGIAVGEGHDIYGGRRHEKVLLKVGDRTVASSYEHGDLKVHSGPDAARAAEAKAYHDAHSHNKEVDRAAEILKDPSVHIEPPPHIPNETWDQMTPAQRISSMSESDRQEMEAIRKSAEATVRAGHQELPKNPLDTPTKSKTQLPEGISLAQAPGTTGHQIVGDGKVIGHVEQRGSAFRAEHRYPENGSPAFGASPEEAAAKLLADTPTKSVTQPDQLPVEKVKAARVAIEDALQANKADPIHIGRALTQAQGHRAATHHLTKAKEYAKAGDLPRMRKALRLAHEVLGA